MNGSNLKYLAAVADLARLDLEAAALTIMAGEGVITASYHGNYARGYRQSAYDGTGAIYNSVSAARFKAMASLFEDDESVDILPGSDGSGVGVILRSQRSRSVVTGWGEPTEPPDLSITQAELTARMPTAEFLSEFEIAASFAAKSQVRPSLEGVRITFTKNRLLLTAYDGAGALYISRIRARVQGSGSMIVPTADFLQGAKLVGDGDIIITKPANLDAVILQNDRAFFRSGLIVDQWPDMRSVTETEHATEFTVEAAQVRNIVAASKALNGALDVSVTQRGRFVLFATEGEGGSFTVAVNGEVKARELFYDVNTLDKAIRLGPVLTFAVAASPHNPTLVSSEHRRCWIMTRG